MTWIVSRDGTRLAEFEDENLALGYLLEIQPFTAEWACDNDGYKIEEVLK